MASLAGTYQYESQENFVEYLQTLGLSAEHAKPSANDEKLTISLVEGDKVTISFGELVLTFTLGKELEYDVLPGIKKKVLATVSGNTLTTKTKIIDDGSLIDEKVFEPTSSGLILHASCKGVKGVRRFKRV